MRTACFSLLTLFVAIIFASALPSRDQPLGPRQSLDDGITDRTARANAVKDAFLFAWGGYYHNAFPNDQLNPVDNTFSNPRNGWGASAVDALSTAIVMEIPDVVDQIVSYIPTIDYGVSLNDEAVSLFETTIRYLGGMLSGYDLLTGPLSYLNRNQTAVAALLTQSKTLANYLSYAFDTPTGIPSNNLFFSGRATDGSTTNGLATIGSLVLEWTHLSDLSGNQTYAQLAQKGQSYLLNPQPAASQPWPGLLGTDVDINTGLFVDSSGGWIAGDDSFYEYLIKMYVYDPTRFSAYKDRWVAAADSTIEYLASHPATRLDLTYLAEFNGQAVSYTSQHLACFAGGSFLLGGMVLNEQKYIDFGLALTDACRNLYTATVTKIGPELFSWDIRSVPTEQILFFQENGFSILNGGYDLRPEVIESYYYAYRITKDPKYQDWAWEAFTAINSTCRVGNGFSGINDVILEGGGGFTNIQETFLFSELMKYSYLIQAPDAEWDVDASGQNSWVFNTEAHPFKVAGPSTF